MKKRAALIDLTENTCPVPPGAIAGAPPALAPVELMNGDPQTTHVNVADGSGNLVTFTVTIEQHYGTGRLLPGYGFFLNNELTDFDPLPGRPNSPAPDKRPLSSMAPTLVFQGGEPVYVLGSPGGPRIISAVAQVLLDLLEYGLDLEQAIAKPRIYSALCNEKPAGRATSPDRARRARGARPPLPRRTTRGRRRQRHRGRRRDLRGRRRPPPRRRRRRPHPRRGRLNRLRRIG
ncbi:gamma-glutamyltransferase [Nannocystis pusilla]|uniref:gamma-glutamyltransferase n=1 Tax=Nannocystis pusilla TaxID=889268 RepID=UPI003B81CABA